MWLIAVPDMIQVFQHRDQVSQVASSSIQMPAHQHVEPSSLRVLQQAIESRAAILCA